VEFFVYSERNPQVIPVDRGNWHGYQNVGPGQAMVLMRLSKKYDPEDEQRMSVKDAYEKYGASWDRHAR